MLNFDYILNISKLSGLPVKRILDLLYILYGRKNVDNRELISLSGIPKNALNQIKNDLKQYLEPVSVNTVINAKFVYDFTNLLPDKYKIEAKLIDLIIPDDSAAFVKTRPEADRDLDQFLATADTVLRRASLLDFLEDVRNKKILFLGDDDHTSHVVASIGRASMIHVVDIDDRILKNLKSNSMSANYDIMTTKHDLKFTLPDSIKGKFDTVFTDPPYTPEGIELFLSRAVSALDEANNAARIYLCFGSSDRSKERFLPVYDIISRHGLMIRYVFDKFNRYEGAESIGNSSSLFILEATPKTRPIIKGNYDESIYTAD